MEFINNGEAKKVRQSDGNGFKWITVHTKDTINLPELVGKNYGFNKVKKVIEVKPKPVVKLKTKPTKIQQTK